VLFKMIRELSIYNLSLSFFDDGGLPGGEINRNIIFTNKNADILVIVTEKSSETNYRIASCIEYIIDEEILRIKKILRVCV